VRQLQLPGDRKLRHLSHGMRMKAALASSLAYRPRLMVLDESFTGLDALVRDELIEGVLAHAEDTTIFISSHDLTEIESFASNIFYLEQGRLEFSEELESMSARFREIALTFAEAPPDLAH
jgi:ABC-2 type transport system ATP-binding protein